MIWWEDKSKVRAMRQQDVMQWQLREPSSRETYSRKLPGSRIKARPPWSSYQFTKLCLFHSFSFMSAPVLPNKFQVYLFSNYILFFIITSIITFYLKFFFLSMRYQLSLQKLLAWLYLHKHTVINKKCSSV